MKNTELEPRRDYRRMARAVADYVTADTELAALHLRVTQRINKASANVSTALVRATEALELARQRVTALAETHPGWFEPKKTLQLPVGSVKRVRATHIDIPDEALTLKRIKEFAATHGEEAAKAAKVDPAQLIRVIEEPAKVFLDQLSDETLALLGVSRVETVTVTVKSVAPKLAKAATAETDGDATETPPAAEEGEA